MSRCFLQLCLALIVPAVLSSCSYLVYRIPVQQGNYVSQDLLSQVNLGMTQDQVRFIMGSPLLVDPFRKDRWDYIYRLSPTRGETELRKVSMFFKDGKLDTIERDRQGNLPATQDGDLLPAVTNRILEIN